MEATTTLPRTLLVTNDSPPRVGGIQRSQCRGDGPVRLDRPEQQQVLRLSIIQGMSHQEISEATGMPLARASASIASCFVRPTKADSGDAVIVSGAGTGKSTDPAKAAPGFCSQLSRSEP